MDVRKSGRDDRGPRDKCAKPRLSNDAKRLSLLVANAALATDRYTAVVATLGLSGAHLVLDTANYVTT